MILQAWIESPEAELTRWRRTVLSAVALAIHCARQLRRDRAGQVAAALAFHTIFGLIPVLVLSLIVMRFFYADSIAEPLRRVLDSWGLGDLSVGAGEDKLGVWIESVVQRVSELNFAAIGLAGVVVLIYAALSLMAQVEHAFNTIYKAPAGRTILAKLTQYWTILTLAPLGVVGSFWISDRFGAIVENIGGGWVVSGLGAVAAVTVSWLVLLLAFVTIPHTRVRMAPALVGSFVAALLWELGKYGFAVYLGFATGYARVYGSLGLIPIFMLWIYFTWLIVLFGLELSYAVQTLEHGLRSFRLDRLARHEQDDVDPARAIAILTAFGEAFNEGRSLTAGDAAASVGSTPLQARAAITALSRSGWIHPLERTDEEPARWALSAPPETIKLEEVVALCVSPSEPASPIVATAQSRVRSVIARAFTGRTLGSMLPADEPGSSDAAAQGAAPPGESAQPTIAP